MSAPPPAEAPPGAVTRPVARWREGRLQQYGDQIAEEVPVAISCNGEHFAVMMATPAQLEDFALGFALSEGLIAAPQELLDLQIQPRLEGVELQLQIPPDRAQALAARARRLEGRSGCGLRHGTASRPMRGGPQHPAGPAANADPRRRQTFASSARIALMTWA